MGGMRDRSTGIKCFAVLAALLILAGCQTYRSQSGQTYRSSSRIDYKPVTGRSPTLNVSSMGWLCGLAIKADAPFWDRSNHSLAEYITEAKRRGYSEQQCARETGRFTEAQIAEIPRNNANSLSMQSTPKPVKTTDAKIKYTTAIKLCRNAILSTVPRWETDRRWQSYVREAKRRGLSEGNCAQLTGRFVDSSPTKSSISRLSRHSSEYICANAISLNYLKWDSDEYFREYVVEAKRRRLNEAQCARL